MSGVSSTTTRPAPLSLTWSSARCLVFATERMMSTSSTEPRSFSSALSRFSQYCLTSGVRTVWRAVKCTFMVFPPSRTFFSLYGKAVS